MFLWERHGLGATIARNSIHVNSLKAFFKEKKEKKNITQGREKDFFLKI